MRDYFHEIYGSNPWGDTDDDDDDNRVVPDGGKVTVPLMLTDHQPGFVPRSTEDAARSEAAWAKRRSALQDAWRSATPSRPVRQQRDHHQRPQQPQTQAPTGDAADLRALSETRFQQRCAKLEDAWRGGEAVKLESCPHGVMVRLLKLDAEVKRLTDRAVSVDARISKLRDLMFGKAERADFNFAAGRAELEKSVIEQSALQRRLRAEEAAVAQCRRWLENLPSDAALEPVEVTVPLGAKLSRVRVHLKTAESELALLRAAPTPSRDIKQRIEAYVDGLAKPKITGIAAGEKLRIIWPGARETISGPSEFSAEALPLFALLFPDQMRDALLAEVERMSNTPLPPQQRAERIKVLEEEVDQLQRAEEVLVTREGAERSTNCSPAAVLGVRVTDARGVRAA